MKRSVGLLIVAGVLSLSLSLGAFSASAETVLNFVTKGYSSIPVPMPDPGEFEAPTDWNGLVCRSTLQVPIDSAMTVTAGATMWLRCVGIPQAVPLDDTQYQPSVRILTSSGYGGDCETLDDADGGHCAPPHGYREYGGGTSGNGMECTNGPGWNPGLGRFEFHCTSDVSGIDQNYYPLWGYGAGQPANRFRFGVTLGVTGMDPYYSPCWESTPDDPTSLGAWGNMAPCAFSEGFYTGQRVEAPAWPEYWPLGSSVPAPPDFHGAIPRLSCREAQTIDADGTPRATVRARIDNPAPDAHDSGYWQYEWEAEGDLDEAGTRAEMVAFWDTAPKHRGYVDTDIAVPLAGAPPGRGWVARFTTVRTYTSFYSIELPVLASVAPPEPTAPDVSVGMFVAPQLLPALELPGAFPHPSTDAGGIKVYPAMTPDQQRALVGIDGYEWDPTQARLTDWPQAWNSIEVHCPINIKPQKAGQTGGDGTTTLPPPGGTGNPGGGGPGDPGGGPGDPGGDPGDPGNGGGHSDGNCGGVGLNPLSWWETLSCSIGDVLGHMFDALGKLLGNLVRTLRWLFIPDNLNLDWDPLLAQVKTKAPWTLVSFAAESVTNFVDDLTADSSCVDVGTSQHHECVQMDDSFPGASTIKAVFSLLLLVGLFTRLAQTAPWAKGRDGGEPGA